ncbi:MAG: putative DNA binding domain-containing protein [Nitrospirae bacterium]|nr:putative DNA binding domain-containing protein [Nitrospirota bacterium]
MTDQEILQLFLDYQEWQTFECKRAAIQPSKLLETAVAFSNTDGGFIVIGLEDPSKAQGEKRLIGISEHPDNVSEFLKLIQKEIDPPLVLWSKFELNIINVKKVQDTLLVVNIKKSNDVHSLRRGDTFVRRGNQNIKIGSSEIMRLKYEKGAIKFESELSGNKNPSVALGSKCGIKISHYYGIKPAYSGEPNFVRRPFTIEGPLLHQIEKSLEYFRNVVTASPPKLSGASFKPSFLIPEWAFQEAVTNSVIHRNYFVQDDIQIRFFDDRVEIESPGTFPGHITVSNIRFERFARNPIILRTLNRFKLAPNLDIGEGVDRMFKVMKEQNLYEPLYFPPTIRPNSVLLFLLNVHKIEYWDTVSKYLDERYYITNNKAREITGITDTIKMSRFLKLWVTKGLLEKIEKKFKGHVYYKKVGIDIPNKFDTAFARGAENGNKGPLFS